MHFDAHTVQCIRKVKSEKDGGTYTNVYLAAAYPCDWEQAPTNLVTVLQGMLFSAFWISHIAGRKHCYQRQTAYIQIRFSLIYHSVWHGGEKKY